MMFPTRNLQWEGVSPVRSDAAWREELQGFRNLVNPTERVRYVAESPVLRRQLSEEPLRKR